MEQNPNTISERVIRKIEEDNVAPLGKWRFVLKNNTFWVLWGLSVLIGACAIAATIFVFINAGWRYQQITHDSLSQFFFDMIPLFWIVSFGLMVFLGYYNVRHTSRGYRFSFFLVVIASVVASIVGGTILYAIGIGKDIDDFRYPIPFADPITIIEENRWNNAGRGLFSGIVKSFDNNSQSLTLILTSGEEKVFFTGELGDMDIPELLLGAHIRIIGGYDADLTLTVACVVLPWETPGVPYNPRQIPLPRELENERKEDTDRTSTCKDIKPYQKYKEAFSN